jgi:FAD/FMN-containing dehydrogenase
VLVEFSSPNPRQGLTDLLTAELQSAAEAGTVQDALIAASIAQAQAMWKLRESVPEAQRHHDVSVPVSAIPRLIEEGGELIRKLAPEGEAVGYGHLGDGNLHFNVSQRPDTDTAAFLAHGELLEHAIFDLVERLGGSISAEHGIGRLKAAEFAGRADPVELALMRDLKRTLDPKGILNPGKVLASVSTPPA